MGTRGKRNVSSATRVVKGKGKRERECAGYEGSCTHICKHNSAYETKLRWKCVFVVLYVCVYLFVRLFEGYRFLLTSTIRKDQMIESETVRTCLIVERQEEKSVGGEEKTKLHHWLFFSTGISFFL